MGSVAVGPAPPPSPWSIQVVGLDVAHGNQPAVLQGVDLKVAQGEVTAVIGPNGAGKSTLLATIAGLVPPNAGSVRRSGRVALALQEAPLASTTVRRNLMLALRWWGEAANDADDRILRALAAFGIEDLADRRARSLSGGERRRVHLARALVVGASALLLDEPFAGLDASVRGDLLADLSGLVRDSDRATVIVVHDRAEAWALADHVVVLLHGRIAASGSPERVFTDPPTPEVARFVGYTGTVAAGTDVILVRPSDLALDPDGEIEASILRRIPTEEGTLLDCRTVGGELLSVRAGEDAPEPGSRVRMRLLGGVRFPHPV